MSFLLNKRREFLRKKNLKEEFYSCIKKNVGQNYFLTANKYYRICIGLDKIIQMYKK